MLVMFETTNGLDVSDRQPSWVKGRVCNCAAMGRFGCRNVFSKKGRWVSFKILASGLCV